MADIYNLFSASGATPRVQEVSGPKQVPQSTKTEFVGYHKFNDYGSFEVYFMTQEDCDTHNQQNGFEEEDEDFCNIGWYWQTCLPGCLPDGPRSGPFYTSEEAYKSAIGE